MRSPKHYLRPSEESSFAGLSGRLSPCLAGWRENLLVGWKIGATFPKQHFREQLAAGCRRTNAKPVVEEGGDRHRHETMVTTRRQAAGVVGGADEKAGGRSPNFEGQDGQDEISDLDKVFQHPLEGTL